MRWFAVHQELATNRKWLELPMDLRGAWITMLTLAAASQPRGRIRDRATAEALFARETATDRDSGDPDYYVGELIDRGWVDEAVDGTLTMHDFDDWQLAIRKPSDLPERIKERVDKHREKAKNPPDPPKEDERTGEQRKVEVTDGNASNALPTPMIPRLGNLYEAFTQLTGLPCTKADEGRIDSLCGQFDRDQVRRAMYADPHPRLSPEKLLGRVYHGLKGAAA